MNLEFVSTAVAEREGRLQHVGSFVLTFTRGARPKHVAHLTIKTSARSVELLVWESGEAELNYGTQENAHYEHHELDSTEALDALVERAVGLAENN